MSKIKVPLSIVTTVSVMVEVDAQDYESACEKIKTEWADGTLYVDAQMAQEEVDLVFG